MAIILLATDDARIHEVLDAELAGMAHEVLWAVNGQDAYDQCLASNPDMVFLAASLSVFDGFACCGLLRGDPDVPRDLPVLLLTDDPPSPHVFDNSGFTACFPETHSMHELRELVSRYAGVKMEPVQ